MSDDFIRVMRGESVYADNKMQTVYVNKNLISGYSAITINKRECLIILLNIDKKLDTTFPYAFHVCKDEDPVTYHKLYNEKSN